MCGDKMIPEGIQDTDILGLDENDVKDIIKRSKNIEEVKATKASKKEEKDELPQSDPAPEKIEPEAYDDITAKQMQEYLAPLVEGELPSDKKELYGMYVEHFTK